MTRSLLAGAAAVGLFVLTPAQTLAQQDARVHLELNKAEQVQGSCRLYLLLDNKTERAYENLQLDLVSFDTDGIIAQRMLLETAPLPAGKMRLKVFDLVQSRCDAVSRILINEVVLCKSTEGSAPDCADALTASTRIPIELVP